MPDSEELTTGILSSSAPANNLAEIPQFATAEYSHIPGTERCRICSNLIAGDYYRVNNQMACGNCARQAAAGQPTNSHAAFLRSLALGIGAAIVSLAGYATFIIATHINLGYLGLAVGWFIAKAIMKGSGGIGGRQYQITAASLTYLAIALARIPIWLSAIFTQSQIPVTGSNIARVTLQLAPRLFGRSLISPFLLLTSFGGVIGLFILFIGLRIAWQLTAARPLNVDGPYAQGA